MTSTAPSRPRTPTPPAKRRNRRNPRVRIPLFAAGVALVVVGLLWLVDSTVHNGEILTGVSAGDVEISGDSPGDARATLSTVAAEREARPVTFRVDDTTGEVTPETMGVTLDTEATAAAALRRMGPSPHDGDRRARRDRGRP